MTAPAPTTSPPGPRVRRLARLRLTHPLRLYTWPGLALLLLVLVLEAAAAGEWSALLAELPVLLLLAGGLWAADRSTFSPADFIRTLREAGFKW